MTINPVIRGFIRKELTQIFRDPKLWSLLIFGPVFQMTMFGYALSTEVKNITLATAGPANDFLLRNIETRALGTGYFVPSKGPLKTDPFDIVQYNQADAVLVTPAEGLSEVVGRSEGKVQLLIDATNVTKAQAIENYVMSIAGSARPPLLQFDTRVLYNPSMKSALFMVPGVLGLLTSILPIVLTAMSVTKEKEDGTFEMLIAAPVTPKEIIIGKTIPFIILGLSNLPFTIAIAYYVFGVPIRGSLLVLVLSFMIFILTTVSCGVLISTITKTQQQSMMGAFLFLFPTLMLSGMIFPVENMPWALKGLALINPLTYFIKLLRNVMLKGGDPILVMEYLGILLLMSALIITWTFRRFRTTVV